MPVRLPPENRERTALVLSAGGVFGAYQAGVWSALADSFSPDMIVGASIGSVNGWLIASGCPPAEMERFWLEAGELMRLRPKIPRGWSHGVLNSTALERRLVELCDEFRPVAPLYVALTEARRLRVVLADGPNLGSEELLASCAVPAAFDLRRINGVLYADGGLLAALPLWAATRIGASRVVAVNAMPPAPFRKRLTAAGCGPETLLIQPDPPLGSYFAMLRYRRDRIEHWIERGRRDGEAARRRLPRLTVYPP